MGKDGRLKRASGLKKISREEVPTEPTVKKTEPLEEGNIDVDVDVDVDVDTENSPSTKTKTNTDKWTLPRIRAQHQSIKAAVHRRRRDHTGEATGLFAVLSHTSHTMQ